jgi:ATP-binding cassette subfamily B (MDR/TAP) protein 1
MGASCLFASTPWLILSYESISCILLFEVSIGAHDVSTINQFGGIVLGIAALDGRFLRLKYYVMVCPG